MEGNYKNCSSTYRCAGFTLVELMVAIAIAGILLVASTSAVDAGRQGSHTNKVKAYLLSVQAIQSKYWLESGIYLPLHALPKPDVQQVSFEQTLNGGVGFEIVATLMFKPATDSCYKMKISEAALSPKGCW